MENVPQTLNCYFSFESGLNFLLNKKFRLSSIFDFNDPFEFLIQTKYSSFFLSLNEHSTESEIISGVENLKVEDPSCCRDIVKRKAIRYVKRMKMFRIGCFSETNANILMWSHYARKHTGLVIGFNTAFDYWGNDFHKVIYSNDRLYFSESSNEESVASQSYEKQLLLQKASCWNYEAEWRYIKNIELLCEHDEYGYFKPVNPKCIKYIIIGCKMSKANIQKLKAIINQDITIYQALPTKNYYSLDFKAI